MARRLARFPLSPRLSRMLVEAMARGVGEDACRAAALLDTGARLQKDDLLEALDLPLDQQYRQHLDQLLRMARPPKQTGHNDEALLKSLLIGFPDRVARLRNGNQAFLSTGLSAEVLGDRPAYEFMVVLDAEDRRENPLPLVRLTSRIEPEWLLDFFPDRIRDITEVVWNRTAERAEKLSTLLYDKLVIDESRSPASETDAANLLADMALEAGIEKFVDKEALDNFLARVEFAGFPTPDLQTTLRSCCLGCRSFNDLKAVAANFLPLLEQTLDNRLLNELAPTSIRLKSGRTTKVHYDVANPPWISSRLQDFFGMTYTPTLGRNKTPLVIHLLAPNYRAVQTTTDLAGFWERLYPQVRRELQRRYPRHAWPEDPTS